MLFKNITHTDYCFFTAMIIRSARQQVYYHAYFMQTVKKSVTADRSGGTKSKKGGGLGSFSDPVKKLFFQTIKKNNMHHGKHFRRLNRTSGHRKALLKNLVSSLIEHGRIETTVAKAKTIQPIADAMITLGKKGDVDAKKQAIAYLNVNYSTANRMYIC